MEGTTPRRGPRNEPAEVTLRTPMSATFPLSARLFVARSPTTFCPDSIAALVSTSTFALESPRGRLSVISRTTGQEKLTVPLTPEEAAFEAEWASLVSRLLVIKALHHTAVPIVNALFRGKDEHLLRIFALTYRHEQPTSRPNQAGAGEDSDWDPRKRMTEGEFLSDLNDMILAKGGQLGARFTAPSAGSLSASRLTAPGRSPTSPAPVGSPRAGSALSPPFSLNLSSARAIDLAASLSGRSSQSIFDPSSSSFSTARSRLSPNAALSPRSGTGTTGSASGALLPALGPMTLLALNHTEPIVRVGTTAGSHDEGLSVLANTDRAQQESSSSLAFKTEEIAAAKEVVTPLLSRAIETVASSASSARTGDGSKSRSSSSSASSAASASEVISERQGEDGDNDNDNEQDDEAYPVLADETMAALLAGNTAPSKPATNAASGQGASSAKEVSSNEGLGDEARDGAADAEDDDDSAPPADGSLLSSLTGARAKLPLLQASAHALIDSGILPRRSKAASRLFSALKVIDDPISSLALLLGAGDEPNVSEAEGASLPSAEQEKQAERRLVAGQRTIALALAVSEVAAEYEDEADETKVRTLLHRLFALVSSVAADGEDDDESADDSIHDVADTTERPASSSPEASDASVSQPLVTPEATRALIELVKLMIGHGLFAAAAVSAGAAAALEEAGQTQDQAEGDDDQSSAKADAAVRAHVEPIPEELLVAGALAAVNEGDETAYAALKLYRDRALPFGSLAKVILTLALHYALDGAAPAEQAGPNTQGETLATSGATSDGAGMEQVETALEQDAHAAAVEEDDAEGQGEEEQEEGEGDDDDDDLADVNADDYVDAHIALITAMSKCRLVDARDDAKTLLKLLLVRRDKRIVRAWRDATAVLTQEHIVAALAPSSSSPSSSSTADPNASAAEQGGEGEALATIMRIPNDSPEMTRALASLAGEDDADAEGSARPSISPLTALTVLSVQTLVFACLSSLAEAKEEGAQASDGPEQEEQGEDDDEDGAQNGDDSGSSGQDAEGDDEEEENSAAALNRHMRSVRALLNAGLLGREDALPLLYVMAALQEQAEKEASKRDEAETPSPYSQLLSADSLAVRTSRMAGEAAETIIMISALSKHKKAAAKQQAQQESAGGASQSNSNAQAEEEDDELIPKTAEVELAVSTLTRLSQVASRIVALLRATKAAEEMGDDDEGTQGAQAVPRAQLGPIAEEGPADEDEKRGHLPALSASTFPSSPSQALKAAGGGVSAHFPRASYVTQRFEPSNAHHNGSHNSPRLAGNNPVSKDPELENALMGANEAAAAAALADATVEAGVAPSPAAEAEDAAATTTARRSTILTAAPRPPVAAVPPPPFPAATKVAKAMPASTVGHSARQQSIGSELGAETVITHGDEDVEDDEHNEDEAGLKSEGRANSFGFGRRGNEREAGKAAQVSSSATTPTHGSSQSSRSASSVLLARVQHLRSSGLISETEAATLSEGIRRGERVGEDGLDLDNSPVAAAFGHAAPLPSPLDSSPASSAAFSPSSPLRAAGGALATATAELNEEEGKAALELLKRAFGGSRAKADDKSTGRSNDSGSGSSARPQIAILPSSLPSSAQSTPQQSQPSSKPALLRRGSSRMVLHAYRGWITEELDEAGKPLPPPPSEVPTSPVADVFDSWGTAGKAAAPPGAGAGSPSIAPASVSPRAPYSDLDAALLQAARR